MSSSIPISVSRLSEFEEAMTPLRELLRSSFLHEAQRKEMKVYQIITKAIRPQVQLLFDSTAVGDNETRACEAHLSLSRHLQVIFSALLLLSPASGACVDTYTIDQPPSSPEDGHAENPSEFYMSALQRDYAMHLLVFLCFGGLFSAQSVLAALYPLLDASAEADGTRIENTIGTELLESDQHRNKKKVVSALLFGVFLSRKNGLLGLMKTFLLNDKIDEHFVFDAVKQMTQLLAHPVASQAWMLPPPLLPGEVGAREGEATAAAACVQLTRVTAEQQIHSTCAQLVALSSEHATFGEGSEADAAPSFLQRVRNAQPLLPRETLEQRLHLCITLLLNEWVSLPPKTDKSFAAAYRHFFFFNKFYLSPAFGALSLRRRSLPDPQAEVVLSLQRLCAILHGNALGCGSSALLCIFEPICPGLLNLLALAHKAAAEVKAALERTVKLLFGLPAAYHQLCVCLVRGGATSAAHRFVVENVVERQLLYREEPCTAAERATGLRELFERAPADFRKYLLSAAVMEFQGSTLLDRKAEEGHEVLAAFVEDMCLGTSAESLFGAEATLLSTLSLAEGVCAVSPLGLQWGASVIAKVADTQFVEAYLSHAGEGQAVLVGRLRHRCQLLRRSLDQAFERALGGDGAVAVSAASCDALCELRVEVEARVAALLNFLATRQGECADVPADAHHLHEDEVRREWEAVSRSFEDNTVRQAYASTMMDLLRLSSSIEENVFLVTSRDRFYAVVQRLLTQLFLILGSTADACVAVHAIRCIGWLGMYRMDSVDSSFLTRLLITALTKDVSEDARPAALSSARPQQEKQPSSVGKVRVLDLLLFWSDHDTDALTLRKIDDAAKAHHGGAMYLFLSQQCLATADPLLQVASLYCVGQYAVATFPRVTLGLVVQLARDVFRLSPYGMAKAAAASMLAHVTALFCEKAEADVAMAGAELAELQLVGEAMRTYRSSPACNEARGGEESATAQDDDEVIRMHGRTIGELLQNSTFQFIMSQ